MTGFEAVAVLPLILLATTVAVTMCSIALRRNHRLVLVISVTGLTLSLGAVFVASTVSPRQATPMLVVDGIALFYTGLILLTALAVTLFSYRYLANDCAAPEEYYLLLLLATLGASVMVSADHFASFFLALETLSVSLYGLVAYLCHRRPSIEAGLKYLILAGASSAFLVFGMGLLYLATGTMNWGQMADAITIDQPVSVYILGGLGMIVVGIGFKLALVPFHMWTPDVYQGAPAPVTAFIATISKGAVFALMLRLFGTLGIIKLPGLFAAMSLIAIASMTAGNLLALLERNIKRILAYSSIAHLGYVLVAFLSAGNRGVEAVNFYLAAYFVTTLGAFGVVTMLSRPNREADREDDYRGLLWRRPGLAAVLTACLLSLAGMPLTLGFMGKFFVLSVGVGSALWLLSFSLIVNSAIAIFYYLRLIVLMVDSPSEKSVAPTSERRDQLGSVCLGILMVLLIGLGVYPVPLMRLIEIAGRVVL